MIISRECVGQGTAWNGTECCGIVTPLTAKVFGSVFGLSKSSTEVPYRPSESTKIA
jgi:hypothetical protein